jgi:hypothetical protein
VSEWLPALSRTKRRVFDIPDPNDDETNGPFAFDRNLIAGESSKCALPDMRSIGEVDEIPESLRFEHRRFRMGVCGMEKLKKLRAKCKMH